MFGWHWRFASAAKPPRNARPRRTLRDVPPAARPTMAYPPPTRVTISTRSSSARRCFGVARLGNQVQVHLNGHRLAAEPSCAAFRDRGAVGRPGGLVVDNKSRSLVNLSRRCRRQSRPHGAEAGLVQRDQGARGIGAPSCANDGTRDGGGGHHAAGDLRDVANAPCSGGDVSPRRGPQVGRSGGHHIRRTLASLDAEVVVYVCTL